MNVRAFQPRRIDPPHFVAEDEGELIDKLGDFISGEQCDGCGNSSYQLRQVHGRIYAVCAVDPDEDDREFTHPDPCGNMYHCDVWDESEVVF